MTPDMDVSAAFGKMIPAVTAWSADSQTLYFETFLMRGCRGPHALYAATIDDLFNNQQKTTLISGSAERVSGLEPLTCCLGSNRSTTELYPRV